MGDVAALPVRKVFPKIVSAEEMHAQPDPTDEMVWAVCPHLRAHLEESRCHRCPRWEEDETYGKLQRGCFGLANEACKIVFAMQERDQGEGR